MIQLFPLSFVNKDYKQHRERVLYERECSLLPETQPKVARIKLRREMETEKKKMMIDYLEKKKVLKGLEKNIQDLDFNIRQTYNERVTRTNEVRVEVIRRCPNTECRGFIQKNHLCGICNIRICNKCHEILNPAPTNEGQGQVGAREEHVCKEEDIETANMILKQTKPCPNCFVSIYKIDGCDQMWCTQCHTAFSWRTGAIETHRIHNPHFYQWQMENAASQRRAPPREPGDIPCGGIPSIYDINEWFKISREHYIPGRGYNAIQRAHYFKNVVFPPYYTDILSIHRIIGHIEHDEMRRNRDYGQINANENEELRIDYLLNAIPEDQFKAQLQQNEKRRQKKHAIFMIMEMFVHTSTDIFRNYIHNPDKTSMDDAPQFIQELNALRNYFNQQMFIVSRQFSCMVPFINEKWSLPMINTDYKLKGKPRPPKKTAAETENEDEASTSGSVN
jgi:hypothetical protein